MPGATTVITSRLARPSVVSGLGVTPERPFADRQSVMTGCRRWARLGHVLGPRLA